MPFEEAYAQQLRQFARRENLAMIKDQPYKGTTTATTGWSPREGSNVSRVASLMADGKPRNTREISAALGMIGNRAGNAAGELAKNGRLARVGKDTVKTTNGHSRVNVWQAV